jgi:hypothetical protein
MARGPRGERRPDDPAQAAVQAVRIAMGEVEEELRSAPREKNAAAVALGRLGGQRGGTARADKLSPTERTAIAKRAAEARWHSKKSMD